VVKAKALQRLIENGMASTALVTHVVVSKFAWFSTLYRQVQILAGHGVHLDRSTLAGWVKRTAWWLKGLYELQLRTIHAAIVRGGSSYVHSSEEGAHTLPARNRLLRGY
jgi:transposase